LTTPITFYQQSSGVTAMTLNFLVTTRAEVLNAKIEEIGECSVIMIDGTVPGWKPRSRDWHFDHHRPGGEKIQIDDIEKTIEINAEMGIDLPSQFPKEKDNNILFCTTQLDADAICSAVHLYMAYLGTSEKESQYLWNQDNAEMKLCAISYDCDHLAVPFLLSKYADFAAQCVAGMKCESDDLAIDLDMPKDRREWTIEDKEYFHSRAFERSFWNLVKAIEGKDNWPCDHPKVDEYWEKVKGFTDQLIEENRITFYEGCAIVTMSGLGETYIDPRCVYQSIDRMIDNYYDIFPIILTMHDVIVTKKIDKFTSKKFVGNKYTLACNPYHPDAETEKINFARLTYSVLSEAEKFYDPDAEGWSGRATVGESNACSNLSPPTVIEIILKTCRF
jgi:hypothetical protein